MDLKTVRHLLNSWAVWHVKASPSTRCALAGFQDVPRGRPPGSTIPVGVDPPEPVRVVLQGLAAIEQLDTRHQQAIGAVRAVYLRHHNAKLVEVAEELGIATKTLEWRRRTGETALLVYLLAKGCRYR
jgi:hypothetical protein